MFSVKDKELLRRLAEKLKEYASDPENDIKKELWRRHNSLRQVKPMFLVFPEGSWRELLPDSALECESADAREIEFKLRLRLYYGQRLGTTPL